MIVALMNKNNFENKLKGILDTAKLKEETGIVILTERNFHIEIYEFMCKHPAINKINMSGSTFFVIKQMRIELKPIDYYV